MNASCAQSCSHGYILQAALGFFFFSKCIPVFIKIKINKRRKQHCIHSLHVLPFFKYLTVWLVKRLHGESWQRNGSTKADWFSTVVPSGTPAHKSVRNGVCVCGEK